MSELKTGYSLPTYSAVNLFHAGSIPWCKAKQSLSPNLRLSGNVIDLKRGCWKNRRHFLPFATSLIKMRCESKNLSQWILFKMEKSEEQTECTSFLKF